MTAPAPTASASAGPREVYREALTALAADDERVLCLDSDLGGLDTSFGGRFPERYVSTGIAEANLFTVSAGLAARGLRPYAHTMATFAATRAAEQLKLDIVGTGLPVRVVATHAGLSAAHFGSTHYCLEDLAVTRALHGLTVVVPADAREIGPALAALHELDGPSYLRLGRSATPPVHGGAVPPFRLGEAVTLRAGNDVTLVACGPLPVHFALVAADRLAADGVGARVLQIHTLAPFDEAAVAAAAAETAGLVTVEEHRPQGGLGDAVTQVVAAHAPRPVLRVAVTGALPTRVDDHPGLLAATGVSAETVHAAALRALALTPPDAARTGRGPARTAPATRRGQAPRPQGPARAGTPHDEHEAPGPNRTRPGAATHRNGTATPAGPDPADRTGAGTGTGPGRGRHPYANPCGEPYAAPARARRRDRAPGPYPYPNPCGEPHAAPARGTTTLPAPAGTSPNTTGNTTEGRPS
ncbi:transketolase C-terminal domain-containing protein [Streptomyces sp. NPDC006274]|uniref:transketolase family protein n=1 Tax=unclassified Streptomyces TaxID=2593676 RepID=UPI0033A898AF